MRSKGGDSFLFLHQFAKRAVEHGRPGGIAVYGLSQPDIICYFPAELMLTRDADWHELQTPWRRSYAPEEAKNSKGWLKSEGLLPQDSDAIDRSVEAAADAARRQG